MDKEKEVDGHPDFAVVWSFFKKFGQQLELEDIMITDVVKWLTHEPDQTSPVVDIMVKLMRKIGMRVDKQRWQKHLVRAAAKFDPTFAAEVQGSGFYGLSVPKKLKLLKFLCEMQFDDNIKFKLSINNEEPEEQRLKPVGRDEDGLVYWHQEDEDLNVRVYIEDEDEDEDCSWKVVCRSKEEIDNLIKKLANEQGESKDENSDEEVELVETKFQLFLKTQCTSESHDDDGDMNKEFEVQNMKEFQDVFAQNELNSESIETDPKKDSICPEHLAASDAQKVDSTVVGAGEAVLNKGEIEDDSKTDNLCEEGLPECKDEIINKIQQNVESEKSGPLETVTENDVQTESHDAVKVEPKGDDERLGEFIEDVCKNTAPKSATDGEAETDSKPEVKVELSQDDQKVEKKYQNLSVSGKIEETTASQSAAMADLKTDPKPEVKVETPEVDAISKDVKTTASENVAGELDSDLKSELKTKSIKDEEEKNLEIKASESVNESGLNSVKVEEVAVEEKDGADEEILGSVTKDIALEPTDDIEIAQVRGETTGNMPTDCQSSEQPQRDTEQVITDSDGNAEAPAELLKKEVNNAENEDITHSECVNSHEPSQDPNTHVETRICPEVDVKNTIHRSSETVEPDKECSKSNKIQSALNSADEDPKIGQLTTKENLVNSNMTISSACDSNNNDDISSSNETMAESKTESLSKEVVTTEVSSIDTSQSVPVSSEQVEAAVMPSSPPMSAEHLPEQTQSQQCSKSADIDQSVTLPTSLSTESNGDKTDEDQSCKVDQTLIKSSVSKQSEDKRTAPENMRDSKSTLSHSIDELLESKEKVTDVHCIELNVPSSTCNPLEIKSEPLLSNETAKSNNPPVDAIPSEITEKLSPGKDKTKDEQSSLPDENDSSIIVDPQSAKIITQLDDGTLRSLDTDNILSETSQLSRSEQECLSKETPEYGEADPGDVKGSSMQDQMASETNYTDQLTSQETKEGENNSTTDNLQKKPDEMLTVCNGDGEDEHNVVQNEVGSEKGDGEEEVEADNEVTKKPAAKKRGKRRKGRSANKRKRPQSTEKKTKDESHRTPRERKPKLSRLELLKVEAESILHISEKKSNQGGEAYRTRSGRRVKSAKKEEEGSEVWQTFGDDEALKKLQKDTEMDEDFQYVEKEKKKSRTNTPVKEKPVKEVKRIVNDDTPCMKCGLFSHPETILLCDGCDKGHHMACLTPPLMIVPDEEWFCPKCSKEKLIAKLKEICKELANKEKLQLRKTRQSQYKKLLNEYTGISATNIIPSLPKPEKPKPAPKKSRKSPSDSGSDSDDSVGVDSFVPSSPEPPSSPEIKPKRRCRKKVSYDFSTFDKTIMDAIGEDIQKKPEKEADERPVSGKDIRTIIAAEKGKDADELMIDEDNVTPGKRRKRNLTNLNSSDEAESGSNYSVSLSEDDEEEYVAFNDTDSEDELLSGGRPKPRSGRGKVPMHIKPKKRSRRLRRKRILADYEIDLSASSTDCEDVPMQKKKKKHGRWKDYGRESSEEEYVPPRRERRFINDDDDDEVEAGAEENKQEIKRAKRQRIVESSSDAEDVVNENVAVKQTENGKKEDDLSSDDWSSLSSNAAQSSEEGSV